MRIMWVRGDTPPPALFDFSFYILSFENRESVKDVAVMNHASHIKNSRERDSSHGELFKYDRSRNFFPFSLFFLFFFLFYKSLRKKYT